jgi:hypothetical protein
VVILNNHEDGHLPFVTRHLAEEPLIIDTAAALEGTHLTYRTHPMHTGIEVVYGGDIVGAVKSVWFRRMLSELVLDIPAHAEKIRNALGQTTEATLQLHKLYHDIIGDAEEPYFEAAMPFEEVMSKYAASSLNRLAGAIAHMFPEALWVSNRDAIARSMHKPAQMHVARMFGLEIPATTFTSDANEAEDFIRHHRVCVVKPLAIRAPWGMNQYTSIVRASAMPDFSGLWANPHIFQELITPAFEVRVTVVRDKVFAAVVSDIDPEKLLHPEKRDWREAFEKGTFDAKESWLPKKVERACISMVRHYGLEAGAFDFIVDKSGRYIFLEIGANGAWAFIEEKTGQQIGKAFADLLQAG